MDLVTLGLRGEPSARNRLRVVGGFYPVAWRSVYQAHRHPDCARNGRIPALTLRLGIRAFRSQGSPSLTCAGRRMCWRGAGRAEITERALCTITFPGLIRDLAPLCADHRGPGSGAGEVGER